MGREPGRGATWAAGWCPGRACDGDIKGKAGAQAHAGEPLSVDRTLPEDRHQAYGAHS